MWTNENITKQAKIYKIQNKSLWNKRSTQYENQQKQQEHKF